MVRSVCPPEPGGSSPPHVQLRTLSLVVNSILGLACRLEPCPTTIQTVRQPVLVGFASGNIWAWFGGHYGLRTSPTRQRDPTKQWEHGHPVWGNESLAVWTPDEPHHLHHARRRPGTISHTSRGVGLPHFTSTGQPSTMVHRDVSLPLLPAFLAAKGCGSRTCQGCPVDNDDDPSAVSGRAPFRRDIDAEVAGDGPGDRAVLQFSHGLLAAGGALPMLCCVEPGGKVSLQPPCHPDHPPRALRSQFTITAFAKRSQVYALRRSPKAISACSATEDRECAVLPRKGTSTILIPAAPGGKGAHLAKLGKASLASPSSLPQTLLRILQTSYGRADSGPTGAKMAPGSSEVMEVTLKSSTEPLLPRWA